MYLHISYDLRDLCLIYADVDTSVYFNLSFDYSFLHKNNYYRLVGT